MLFRIIRSAGTVIVLLAIAGSAQAQYVISTKAGIIQFAEGQVFLDDKAVRLSEGDFTQMENGQTLRTGLGFVELLLSADIYMRLSMNSAMKMYQNKLDDIQLELVQGSALIEAVEKTKGNQISIKFAEGLIEIKKKGLYRLDKVTNELRVYSGEARVARKSRKAKIKSGKMVCLNGDLKPSEFDRNAMDLLHKWAALRSFTLFVDFPDARTKRHWTDISLGWLRNYDYGMSLRSEKTVAEWMQARDVEAKKRESISAAAARQRQASERMRSEAAKVQEAIKSATRGGNVPHQ